MAFVDLDKPDQVQVLLPGKKEPIWVPKQTQERFPDRYPLAEKPQAKPSEPKPVDPKPVDPKPKEK